MFVIYGERMPQIRCPNCGTTINLENRKKIDFDLIVAAVRRKPENFTALLKITRLPRKTLNLRLKELCENKTIVKDGGKYRLNDSKEFMESVKESRLSRILRNSKTRTGLIFVSLIALSSVSGYNLAVFLGHSQPSPADQKPVVFGNLTMALNVSNVTDLFAWQALVEFNASELRVLEVKPGEFLPRQYMIVLGEEMSNYVIVVEGNSGFLDKGILLLGGTMLGNGSGVNGSGRLAIITFARYTENYSEPKLIQEWNTYGITLIDSTISEIPPGDWNLTLSVIEKVEKPLG